MTEWKFSWKQILLVKNRWKAVKLQGKGSVKGDYNLVVNSQ